MSTPPLRVAAAALALGALLGRVDWVALAGGPAAGDVVRFADRWPVAWPVLAALVAVATAFALRRPWTRGRWLVLAAAAALAVGWTRARHGATCDLALPALEVAELTGTAESGIDLLREAPDSDPSAPRRAAFRMSAGGATARVTFDVLPGATLPDLLPGDPITVLGRVRPRATPRNPGASRFRNGTDLDVWAAEVTRTGGPATGALHVLRRLAERLRGVVRDRLRDACGGETRAFGVFLCLLTGDRSALPPDVARAFRDSGTAHLLAVSGLHLVLLVAVAAAVGRRVAPESVRKRAALPALAALVIVYTAVCRFDTPVVRSAVFLLVSAAGRSARRRTRTIDHLALAASIVLAADPDQIADAGFQLSFAAVAGIALFTTRLRGALFPRLALYAKFPDAIPRRHLRFLKAFSASVSTSLAAQIATAPVVAAHFGTCQPAGPVANLVAVPLFAAVLPFGLGLAAVGGTLEFLTRPLATWIAATFVGVASVAAAAPFGHAALGRPPPVLLGLSVALLVAAARPARWTRGHLALPLLSWCAVAVGPLWTAPAPQSDVVVLDVGHGLAVIVRSSEGGVLVYDSGGRSPSIGERTVVPALRSLGVRRIDILCVSHEDADHAGGVADVLREFPIGQVVVPAGFGVSPIAQAVIAAAADADAPVVHALRGDLLDGPGLRARVLGPSWKATDGAENDDSLVLAVETAHGPSVLLTGDLEDDALAALTSGPPIPASDILVLAHHGRGDAERHLELARRCGAAVLVASESDPAAVAVPAWITGLSGALRIGAGGRVEAFPWR